MLCSCRYVRTDSYVWNFSWELCDTCLTFLTYHLHTPVEIHSHSQTRSNKACMQLTLSEKSRFMTSPLTSCMCVCTYRNVCVCGAQTWSVFSHTPIEKNEHWWGCGRWLRWTFQFENVRIFFLCLFHRKHWFRF